MQAGEILIVDRGSKYTTCTYGGLADTCQDPDLHGLSTEVRYKDSVQHIWQTIEQGLDSDSVQSVSGAKPKDQKDESI